MSAMQQAPLTPAQSAWVESTFARLNPRERLMQLECRLLPQVDRAGVDALVASVAADRPGSVFVGGEIISGAHDDPGAIAALTGGLCTAMADLPPLVAADAERGVGASVQGVTELPHQLALGAAASESLAYDYGAVTGIEARRLGITWAFAPVADLLRNWFNPAVMSRALGADPELVGRLAGAVTRGMQDHGLVACAKHFPGDGIDFRDQHLATSVNSLDEASWRRLSGRAFALACGGSGAWSVMAGHIALPWCDPIRPGSRRPRPATVSEPILTGLLRRDLGYEGVVVSDALIMAGVTGWAHPHEVEIQALAAGVDVLLWPEAGWAERAEAAIAAGRLTRARIDEAVRRVLAMKARRALPSTRPAEPADAGAWAAGVARQVAAGGIVTVRDDARLLPWDPATVRRVLILLSAGRPSDPAAKRIAPLVAALEARGCTVEVLCNPNCLDITRREAAGGRWDAMLAVFALEMHELKNTARPAGAMAEGLWSMQMPRTVSPVVVSLGSPFLLHELPAIGTLVNVHSSSPASQQALAAALFGEQPPTGRSPVPAEASWVAAAVPGAVAG